MTNFLRRTLGIAVATGLVILTPGMPTASAAPTTTTYTFASKALCTTSADGLVSYTAGDIVIDVDKLDPAITDVVIPGGAALSCQGVITSLSWTGSHPLNSLELGGRALYQDGVDTFTTVSFPEHLTSLILGFQAVAQRAAVGSNALTTVTFPAGLTSLTVGEGAFGQDAPYGGNALTEVRFPASLTSLSIEQAAFRQSAEGGGNTLARVEFQGSYTSLSIGYQAFYQYSKLYDNALGTLSWPSGLTDLTIGEQAFAQSAANGKTALASLSFPSGLVHLVIRDQAFMQYAASGTLSLATVRFPGSLALLTIGTEAFRQMGSSVLSKIILEQAEPWTGSPTMAVNDGAFAGSSTPTWYWFGADATNLADAWNGTINGTNFTRPTLFGYRRLSFDTGGGVAIDPWYVYPGGAHTTQPQVLPRAKLDGAWTVSLPSAARDGYSFGGWCPSASVKCVPKGVGADYTLAQTTQEIAARWRLLAPVMATGLPSATVGSSYQASVASGAELTCAVTSGTLPPGLTLTGCAIVGTPTVAANAAIEVSASNSAGSPSAAYTLTVHNAAPVIGSSSLGSGTVTVPFTADLPIAGTGTISCAVTAGELPAGLTLSGCRLTGTPARAGAFSFTITASNDGGSAAKAFALSVAAAKKFSSAAKPTISGKLKVGKTLKAKAKSWKPKAATLHWQWYRNGVPIAGATKASYRLVKLDKGKKLKVLLVGTKIGYQSSAYSKSTGKVK